MIGSTGVVNVLGSQVTDGGKWSIQGANYVGDGDSRWCAVQTVATFGAALAGHEPGLTQLAQYAFKEFRGDSLRLSEMVALGQSMGINDPGCGKFDHGASAVVDPGGYVHGFIVSARPTASAREHGHRAYATMVR